MGDFLLTTALFFDIVSFNNFKGGYMPGPTTHPEESLNRFLTLTEGYRPIVESSLEYGNQKPLRRACTRDCGFGTQVIISFDWWGWASVSFRSYNMNLGLASPRFYFGGCVSAEDVELQLESCFDDIKKELTQNREILDDIFQNWVLT